MTFKPADIAEHELILNQQCQDLCYPDLNARIILIQFLQNFDEETFRKQLSTTTRK